MSSEMVLEIYQILRENEVLRRKRILLGVAVVW